MSKIAPIMMEEMQYPWKYGQTFHPYSIYKKHDTLRYVTFLYTKFRNFAKSKTIFTTFLYTKIRTLCGTRFLLDFWNWRRGGGGVFLYSKNNALCVIFLMQKTIYFALRFYVQKSRHFALHLYMQKKYSFRYFLYLYFIF